jgi:hypothetical protein
LEAWEREDKPARPLAAGEKWSPREMPNGHCQRKSGYRLAGVALFAGFRFGNEAEALNPFLRLSPLKKKKKKKKKKTNQPIQTALAVVSLRISSIIARASRSNSLRVGSQRYTFAKWRKQNA